METQYYWPEKHQGSAQDQSPLKVKKETVFEENQVTYMSDQVSKNQS